MKNQIKVMKYIISLSLLFISCIFCKGQYFRVSDSSGIIIIGTSETIDSAWLAKEKKLGRYYTFGEVTMLRDSIWYSWDSIRDYHEKRTDTIKIIYQYSNTAEHSRWVDTGQVYFYDHTIRWSYGYLVIVNTIHSSLEHYLDADKNKLWKNIIVWKYIEIE